MDYVTYVTRLQRQTRSDAFLRATHQSLLWALVDKWNNQYRQQPFAINQKEIMQWAKISNANTYTRCLRDLNGKYIIYNPGKFPRKPAFIAMIYFEDVVKRKPKQDTAYISELTYSDDTIDINDISKMPHSIKKSFKKDKSSFFIKNKFDFQKSNSSPVVSPELGRHDLSDLRLSIEILEEARQKRINQLIGTNERSILLLLQAYLDNKKDDPLLLNDRPNLIAIAQKIVAKNHS